MLKLFSPVFFVRQIKQSVWTVLDLNIFPPKIPLNTSIFLFFLLPDRSQIPHSPILFFSKQNTNVHKPKIDSNGKYMIKYTVVNTSSFCTNAQIPIIMQAESAPIPTTKYTFPGLITYPSNIYPSSHPRVVFLPLVQLLLFRFHIIPRWTCSTKSINTIIETVCIPIHTKRHVYKSCNSSL